MIKVNKYCHSLLRLCGNEHLKKPKQYKINRILFFVDYFASLSVARNDNK